MGAAGRRARDRCGQARQRGDGRRADGRGARHTEQTLNEPRLTEHKLSDGLWPRTDVACGTSAPARGHSLQRRVRRRRRGEQRGRRHRHEPTQRCCKRANPQAAHDRRAEKAFSGQGNDGRFWPAGARSGRTAAKSWRWSQGQAARTNRRKRNQRQVGAPNGAKLSDGGWRKCASQEEPG